jgi:hypothetical protein
MLAAALSLIALSCVPSAAVPLAKPSVLAGPATLALVPVKAVPCQNVCVQWKPCPPLGQVQPDGCWIGSYPNLQHAEQYCIKHRRFCGPPPGAEPPHTFTPVPSFLDRPWPREPGLGFGHAPNFRLPMRTPRGR